MSEQSGFSKRVRAFGFAFRGLGRMFKTEVHARVHLAAAIIVIATGLVVGLSRIEWSILVLTIALVIALEAVNTSVEAICDTVSEEHHPLIEIAKDVAAGAVLVAALVAVAVAVLIFGPHLF